jgi:hypothetical protein
MDTTRVKGFLRVNRNDFWRGLYIISVWWETKIHRFTLWAFHHVNYGRVQAELKIDESAIHFESAANGYTNNHISK